jgi:hypothetical protein
VTIPSPISNPEAWGRLVIGGVEFRGAFEFSGDALKRKLDHRHSASRDGARIRDRGYDLAKIKLALRCYEDEHFEDLEALVRLLFPRDADATRRAAYACTHPALAVAGITEVYAESMDVLHMVEERGRVWGTTIDLVSIGVVAEDGREFYAVSTEFDPERAGWWVRQQLQTCPIRQRRSLPARLPGR